MQTLKLLGLALIPLVLFIPILVNSPKFFLNQGTLTEAVKSEVVRLANRSSTFEAVLVETNGGATTSFGYEVHIVSQGAQVQHHEALVYLYGATRNRFAYGANLRWESSNSLVVEYLEARYVKANADRIILDGQTIDIIVRPNIEDPCAPSGGMLQNLPTNGPPLFRDRPDPAFPTTP